MTTIASTMKDARILALLNTPLFTCCTPVSLAHLLPFTKEVCFSPGEDLFTANTTAEQLFILLEGEVELTYPNGTIHLVTKGEVCGEESAITPATHYLAHGQALSPVRAVAIPQLPLKSLLKNHPSLEKKLQQIIVDRFLERSSSQKDCFVDSQSGKQNFRLPMDTGSWRSVIGWLSALVLPPLGAFFAHDAGLSLQQVLFIGILIATAVMWIFQLLDEYVPGLFALFSLLMLDLGTPSKVLAGFSSDGMFLALSILGLGAIIVTSGLSYRFLLWLLLHLPNRALWQDLGLLSVGFLLSPVVPSINGRVALATPLMKDMAELLGLSPGGRGATRLAVTTFVGASLLSAVFLTSKSVNLVIYGMLSSQDQDRLHWLGWLNGSLVIALVLIILHLISCTFFLRQDGRKPVSKTQLTAQLALLGPLRNEEWAAMLGMIIFSIGVATTSLHRIPSPWLALAILYTLLSLGFISKKDLREKVDWPFLLYLGGLVGITNGIKTVGLDRLLEVQLVMLGSFMRSNLELFFLGLFGLLFVIRLAVPISATIAITATVFVPLSQSYGINPWVMGMAILVLGEMWFFPYQCSYYLQFRELTGRSGYYNESTFLWLNALGNLTKLLALYLSLPWWRWLGLL